MAMIVLVISLMSLTASTLRSHTLRRQNRERAVVQNAVRSTAERIQSFSFRLIETSPETWAENTSSRGSEPSTAGSCADCTSVTGASPALR